MNGAPIEYSSRRPLLSSPRALRPPTTPTGLSTLPRPLVAELPRKKKKKLPSAAAASADSDAAAATSTNPPRARHAAPCGPPPPRLRLLRRVFYAHSWRPPRPQGSSSSGLPAAAPRGAAVAAVARRGFVSFGAVAARARARCGPAASPVRPHFPFFSPTPLFVSLQRRVDLVVVVLG